MKLLSLSDLETRWCYGRAGIHQLSKRADFPKPFALVSKGRVKIYQETDIEAYEKDRPWLFHEEQKQQRRRLYGLLNLAKTNEQDRSNILQHAFGRHAKNWNTE